MAVSAFQRLLRVLELEEKQGWRNRAVIGGLAAMGQRWADDARQEGADAQVVEMVLLLMVNYQEADQENRPDILEAMRQALGGLFSDLDELLAQTGIRLGDEVAPAGQPDEGPVAAPPQEAAAVPPPEPTHVAEARIRQQQARRDPAQLEASPQILGGVGSATAEQLARLGIRRVVDLLWHLPTRHEDYSTLRPIAQLEPNETVTIIANLWDIRERKVSMNRHLVEGILADASGTIRATWWNRFVRKQLQVGSTMRFSGKVGLFLGQKTLENPLFEDVDEEMVATGRLAPVYRLTEGLSNKRLRHIIKTALDDYADLLTDPLPQSIRDEYDLLDLPTALRQVHFPDSPEQLQQALRRLAFEELFYLQLGVAQRRYALRQATALPMPVDPLRLRRFSEGLPFALTGAQRRVIDEIGADMARAVPMTRLVQGDVGSGKTVVAAAAMAIAAAHGAQSALLAPTQILAEQHHRSLGSLLAHVTRPDGSPLRVALLTGRVTGAEREAIVAGLREPDHPDTIDVVVGTTALIQEAVEFHNLGFVVVDEQHRFGVEQRGALRNKGAQPHLLVMSATPIPRSLALTLYGDLDVSVLDEMPPGRTPVKTKRFYPRERERLYSFIRRQVQEGRQAYIVYPLVEESEKLAAGAATAEYERLRTEIFPDLRLALLHGRMSGAEKDEVMAAFAAGEYDILVSTTVIEVGIDVPNASIILIEDAERFGLAQLHQLRGRVGRGERQSYCALISRVPAGSEAEERLRALEEIDNGFELAEKDLELRGPGDFLGTRQSGLPPLRVAQLSDMATLSAAREAAQALIRQDPELIAHPQLAQQVQRFWRGHGDVS